MRISDWSSDVCSSDLRASLSEDGSPEMTSSTLQRAVKLCFPSPGSVVGHFPTIDDQCVTCMIARCVTGEVYRRACKVVRRARTAQWRLESDSGSYFRAHFGIGLRPFRNDETRRSEEHRI